MSYLRGALAIRVFLCFASAYLLSYAFRSINAVIAPALMEDIDLSNADLGLLSAAYFLSFAGMQLPLGVWLDKYGPRKTEVALLLIAAAGSAIFASSDSLSELWIGRALIGVGVSACLMASFKAYRQWFAPERQSQLASWMLVAGTAGALSSTVPVSSALPLIGWRGVFWVMSAMILAAAAAIFFLLKKVEASHAPATSATNSAAPKESGYAQIFGSAYFRRMALLAAVNHGSFIALQTLWAGPWMMTVLEMDKQETARVLFIFNLLLLLGYLGLAWWAPRHVSHGGSRGFPVERVIAIGLGGAIAVQAAMVLFTAPWTWIFWIALGIFITVTILMQTSVSLSFPTALAGRANSAFNLMVFAGAFIAQWGLGMLIDLFSGMGAAPPAAMRIAFAVSLACQILTLLVFLSLRPRPQA